MNADLIFKAFGEANSDYLIHAEQSMTSSRPMPNRGAKLRFSLIAAAIVAIIMIPLTVIIANHYGITPPPIPVITTPEETYKSLTDIPGAIAIEDSTMFDPNPTNSLTQFNIKRFINQTKERNHVIVGTVSNSTSIIIKDEEYDQYWHITTLDITVNEAICNMEKTTDTVKVVCTRRYYIKDDKYQLRPFEFWMDFGLLSTKEPYAFYILDSIDEQIIKINGTEYPLADYADYYLGVRCDILYDDYSRPYAYYPNLFCLPIDEFRETPQSSIPYDGKVFPDVPDEESPPLHKA